jgi:hypothetical protein
MFRNLAMICRLSLGLVLLSGCGQRIVPNTAPIPMPDSGAIETTLFLIGDAGAPNPADEPVLHALNQLLLLDTARSVVLFLGDNVYPRGLPDSTNPAFAEGARRLDAQIDLVVHAGVRGFFIPGNHDWDHFGADGWSAIRRQGVRIAQRGAGRARLLPAAGCPGPAIVDLGRRLRLVLLDTQWWLHGGEKPTEFASLCPGFTESAVISQLGRAVSSAGEREVVVAGHHPFVTGGEHGGFFDWHDHLFPLRAWKKWLWLPLPGLGSLYPIARGFGISRQDVSSDSYRRMRQGLESALRENRPLVYAAGHEHALQVITGIGGRYQLVSGAGIYGHNAPVVGIPGTVLAVRSAGFMRLDVLHDGRVRLGVVTVDGEGRGSEIYSAWLAGEK